MHLSMKIKIILFTAFILFTTTISSQQIEWLTLAEAMEAQKKIPKKITKATVFTLILLSNNNTMATHPQKRLERVRKLGICFNIIIN